MRLRAGGGSGLLLAAACWAALAVAAPAEEPPPEGPPGPPAAIPLGDGWEYRHDPAGDGESRGLHVDGAAGFEPVAVPHVLDPNPLDHNFGGTIGWYRIRLDAPRVDGYEWAVRFEQARRRARVWLNGVEIGGSDHAYAPFEVPLTGLRHDGTDALVVRVDSRKSRAEREGWWNWGGLTRPVSLVPLGPVSVRELGLMPRVRCRSGEECAASVLVDGLVENLSERRVRVSVGVSLSSPRGEVTKARIALPRRLAPGARARLAGEIAVEGRPEIWWPDEPALYDAEVTTHALGRVAQVDRMRIGLRQVTVRRGELRLNGRRLRMRGASIQEDVAGRGAALTDADVERIAQDLVEVGANVTRAHYPLDERLLRRFDELGILVWNQAPVYHADKLLRRRSRMRAALTSVRAAVLAGRNHPSVITHSVANELAARADRTPKTRQFLVRAARLARRLDPRLPVSLDILSYPRISRQRVYDRFDALGVNNYFGWYSGRDPHSTRDFFQLEPYLNAMRARYPKHALVMTEFGAEALEDGPADVKGTYAFQTGYLDRVLDVFDRNEFVGGAIYWTLHEFAVKPRWDGGVGRSNVAVDAIHNKGLIGYDGERKPAWNLARERFSAEPPIRRRSVRRDRSRARGAARPRR